MEQVQRYYVKFNTATLDIQSMGPHYIDSTDCTVVEVTWDLISPFFIDFKNISEFYPLIENGKITGFRRKKMFTSRSVKNDDLETIKAIRPFENFIADCAILAILDNSVLKLHYDKNHFDSLTNQENIERLTLVKGKQYNIHITEKGNPYNLYEQKEIQLDSFVEGVPIQLSYNGPEPVSVYVTTKN